MTIMLDKIKRKFDKASVSYDSVADAQREAAKFLVNKLLETPCFSPKTILDLGTGTGYIPELLLPKVPQSSFYLNDIAEEMLKVCEAKFDKAINIHYLPGDMMSLNIDFYDCIISNFALQWVSNLQDALKFFHSKSANVFAFSTLLEGTFQEWENILKQYQFINTSTYPNKEELVNLCNNLKKPSQVFEFWLMDIPLTFENPSAFINYLKLLGASSSNNFLNTCDLKHLLKTPGKNITVTYKIFFGIFRETKS